MTGPGTPTQPNTQPPNPHVARVVPRGPLHIPRRRRRLPGVPGLLPNEREIWARRQSRLYLAISTIPLVLGLAVLVALHLWLGDTVGIVQWILMGALVVLALRWLFTVFVPWFFTVYFLTDQRVIKETGFFNRVYNEAVLKNVVDVTVELPNFLDKLLGIGSIDVVTLATTVHMAGLAEVRELADLIRLVQRNPAFGLPAAPAAAALPALPQRNAQDALIDLSKPTPIPPPPPRSTQGSPNFIRRTIPMQFIEDEHVIELVYRHWIILLRNQIPAILILIATIVIGVFVTIGGGGSLLAVVIAAGLVASIAYGLPTYVNWADDVLILTTHRIVDVDRLFLILSEYSTDAPYARIQGIDVRRNWLGRILGFGDIEVHTIGRSRQIEMSNIPHAAQVMDRIYGQKNRLEAQEAINATNRIRGENAKWFATLGSQMLKKVPDVRGMAYLAALTALRGADLKLEIEEERPQPGAAPGVILEQDPTADTILPAEGEVRVVLSRT